MTFVRWLNVSPTRERARPSSRIRAIVAWSTGSWAERTQGRNDATTQGRSDAKTRRRNDARLVALDRPCRPCAPAALRPSLLLIELPPPPPGVGGEDRG